MHTDKIKWDLLTLILLILSFVVIVQRDIGKYDLLNKTYKEYLNGRTLEAGRYDDLRTKLTMLKTTNFIELIAREKLGLIKKSETAYKIVHIKK